jgi:predicted ATP-dependent serine protease
MLPPKRILVCPHCKYLQAVFVNQCRRCHKELTQNERVAQSQFSVVHEQKEKQ